MTRRFLMGVLGLTAFLMLAVVTQALAQGAAGAQSISISEHPEFGQYLTDAEGMTLYMFVQDAAAVATPDMELERMTEGVRPEAAQCLEACLANWPPLLAEDGAPTIAAEAEGQLDQELLYVADVDGRQQVVYNGWPLYYFANDTQAGDVNGQGVGNQWFVVSPEGELGGGVAGGGEAQPGEGAGEEGAPEDADGPMDDAGDGEDGAGDAGAPGDAGDAGAPDDAGDGGDAGDGEGAGDDGN